MKPCITNFVSIRPSYELPQERAMEWVALAHAKAESIRNGWADNSPEALAFYDTLKERLVKLGIGPNKVQMRGCSTDDFFHQDWDKMEIYKVNEHIEGALLKTRMGVFEKAVDQAFESFYPVDTKPSPHLIHVSCTGYISPSGAQKIVAKRKASSETAVTHAYHMGCYAALPALRIASGFLHSPPLDEHAVDIVHTELCSLHMNPSIHDMDQLVIQSLFGDGFIKYQVIDKKVATSPYLDILALHEEAIPDSTDGMMWKCEHWGFRMTIAKEVPVLIRRAILPFFQTLMKKADMSFEDVMKKAVFAIHPGGPKIIEQIADFFHLEPHQYEHSSQVLRDFGNMSSATIPHVWDRILKDPKIPVDSFIISVAFGPGLSISGALFQKGIPT